MWNVLHDRIGSRPGSLCSQVTVPTLAQVLAPRVKIVMPLADEDGGQVSADVARGDAAGEGGPPAAAGNKRGPKPAQVPDTALPDLVRFLGAHPELKAVAKAEKVSSVLSPRQPA